MLFTVTNCHERINALWLEEVYRNVAKLERAGWVRRNIPNPETVAEHQISAALMVTRHFREKVQGMGLDILRIQDTLLIHDLAEPDPRVNDRTPHDIYDPAEHRKNEELVIREILWNNSYLLNLWLGYFNETTREWKMSLEFDKLQAVYKAREYEDRYNKDWLVREFFSTYYSVTQKTDFLLRYASDLYENKPR